MTTKTNKSSNHCLIICCGQGLVVCHCLIICCGQGLVASYCFITFATKTKFHSPKRAFCAILSFAVVWGWWSAIVLSFAVVRRWWPAIVLSHVPPKPNFTVQNQRFARFYHLPWSGVAGLLLSYHLLWPGVGHLPPKTNFIV